MRATQVVNTTPWTSYDTDGHELNNGSYRNVTVAFDNGETHTFETCADGGASSILGYNDISIAIDTGADILITGQRAVLP